MTNADWRRCAHVAFSAWGLLGTVVACSPPPWVWTPRQYIDRVVWTEDDTQHALMFLRYEERLPPPITVVDTTEKRNFEHQLAIQQADGSGRRTITGWRQGQGAARLYAMRARGYAIVGHLDALGGEVVEHVLFSNGSITPLGRLPGPTEVNGCGTSEWMPSPDGEVVAHMERLPGCTTGNVRAELLDGVTLAVRQPAVSLEIPGGRLDWTWVPSGDLVVVDVARNTAWRLNGNGFEPTVMPRCTWPRTTSSEFSRDGRQATTNSNGDTVLVLDPTPGNAFGCPGT